MRRHSSGSSQDGDTSPVEAPHVSSSPRLLAVDANSPTQSPAGLDRRRSTDKRSASTRSRRSSNVNWMPSDARDGLLEKLPSAALTTSPPPLLPANGGQAKEMEKAQESRFVGRRPRLRSPWAITFSTLVASILGIGFLAAVLHSSVTRQLDSKGCRMSYMRPGYARLDDFDTEHTRFASKYSLYLYREQGIDHGSKVKGIPILFIPGNAGSYKQVRPIAAEAANYFHDVLQHDEQAVKAGVRSLDFFTVDFNEDITAFHGQTLLDQAEYLNEAIRYILSLYLDPRVSDRDPDLPDPTSVIVLGHSMGGVVARTMLIMPNYQSNSINTIVTMSAPHARPPVSFDGQIVKIYQDINDYWRHAYSQQWANNNPLWHVTLVSIAGGGLDTVVPSDYASVESLVPDTHGFTAFTTTIPNVWTSMDHQAILWCDQFRKVFARAIYDVVDVSRATQTKPRAERMRVFKRWFLTGMETVAEKTVPLKDPTTLLTLEDNSNSIIAQGERLVLRRLGASSTGRAHLLPIPPPGSPDLKRFTLLTDQKLDNPGENGRLEVLFCSVFPLQAGQATTVFPSQINLSGETTGSTRLACKNAASDVIALPASYPTSRHPFSAEGEREMSPFSYLQYEVDDISEHQFVAIVDKATTSTACFVIAEFSDHSQSHRTTHISLRRLLSLGMRLRLPAERPMVTEIKVPSLQSSLLAYNLEISNQACKENMELFSPLLRQYLTEPYESKYFVNVRHATVSLHGVAPYVPPPLTRRSGEDGLIFQFWTDPTCNSNIEVKLTVDAMGSLGKLYMRYRTVFAAFPLLVVALVLRKQFRIYDSAGVFVSFSESLDMCLRQSIPLMLASLTILSLSIGSPAPAGNASFWHWRNSTSSIVDFHQNDLLIGTQDPFFWFLIPLIGLICVGVCTVLNYITLALTHLLSAAFSLLSFRPGWIRNDDRRKTGPPPAFLSSSPRRRMITTVVLLFLVSTFIPYQFAYLVACLVQLTTTVRAQRIASELRSSANSNFYNYVHSILVLMLWILPINVPTLVVWVHNLAVQWLTPFSSHHNVLSIMPFIVLVETLTTGKMIPRVSSRFRHFTSVLLFGISIYAAVYGVSYAYMLHYLVNLVAAWLVVVHSTSDSWPFSGLSSLYEGNADDRKRGKEP
ncbi:PGAP1-like protein-domain-containing protein [Lasiosphaeria hispida]|uniref:GPI inositol-deacylase n=1 Tax=Lasiosphaeria hispida TaxID=260671 RepID=A0AAJ0MER6_9PEZI|nr:PGAP1-like protein-domain-containing protein [Lasiosphaeria hispida]